MNKVKKTCIILLAAVAVLAVTLSAVLYATRDRGCFSSVIIWCDQDPPTTYEQADGVGYLTVPYKNFDGFLTMTVEDETLQNELTGADMSEIVGLKFGMYISGATMDELGLSLKNFDASAYMAGSNVNGPGTKLLLNEVYYN